MDTEIKTSTFNFIITKDLYDRRESVFKKTEWYSRKVVRNLFSSNMNVSIKEDIEQFLHSIYRKYYIAVKENDNISSTSISESEYTSLISRSNSVIIQQQSQREFKLKTQIVRCPIEKILISADHIHDIYKISITVLDENARDFDYRDIFPEDDMISILSVT